jgi:hypothetical protein
MKKINLNLVVLVVTLLGVLLALTAKAQKTEMSASFYYGTSNVIGTNVIFGKFGFGISLGVKGPVGEDYSNTMGPNAFREDIYQIIEARNVGIKVMYGDYIIPKTKVSAVLGYGSYSIYHNAYDHHQILSPSGYYYTAVEGKSVLIYGVNVHRTITEPKGLFGIGMGIEAGYNNFDNLHLGVSMVF